MTRTTEPRIAKADAAVEAVAKAQSHPVRRRVLNEINLGIRSPNSLAEQLGEPLGNVSYHVKTLAGLGLVECVGTEPRRGAVEHFYATTSLGASAAGGDSTTLDHIAAVICGWDGGSDSAAYDALEAIETLVRNTGRKTTK